MSPALFTIGHSRHEPEKFLRLLQAQEIQAVADVRTRPFSRYCPQFNREELVPQLKRSGIDYVFFGEELGGRPEDLDLYDDDGRVNYKRVRKSYLFRQGLDRLLRAAEELPLALLCAEEDPLHCHRGLMIAPALVERGSAPAHMRGNGTLEAMADMEERLLAETKVGDGLVDGLFAATLTDEDRRAMLEEAYRRMARKRAFRLRPGESTQTMTEDEEMG